MARKTIPDIAWAKAVFQQGIGITASTVDMVGQVLEVARTTIEKSASVKLTSFEACTWRLKDKRVSACQKVNLGMPVERCRALTFRAAWILNAHVTCMFSLLFDSPGKHLGHREGGHCEKGI